MYAYRCSGEKGVSKSVLFFLGVCFGECFERTELMFESMSRVQSMSRARFPVFWRCGACLSTYITYMGYLGVI